MSAVFEGRDRRRAVRWYGDISSDVVFFIDSKPAVFHNSVIGDIKDLSALGACVEVSGAAELKMEHLFWGLIKVALEWPLFNSERRVNAVARTVWIKESGDENKRIVGIEFVDLPTGTSDGIKNYIAKYYIDEGKNKNK